MQNSVLKSMTLALVLGFAGLPATAQADCAQQKAREIAQGMASDGYDRVIVNQRLFGQWRAWGQKGNNVRYVLVRRSDCSIVKDRTVEQAPPDGVNWAQQGPDFADIEGRQTN